ncbi:MAG: type II secretion system F family protein, partial [Candidatus Omnitrophica bacterium]|nr:type II secretion system F family protein [Candidatus Omnitrophota bacterium]
MTLFKYTARDSKGNLVTGSKESSEQEALLKELRSQSIFPISINEVKPGQPKKKFYLPASRSKEVFVFTRNLANLLNSGLILPKALELLVSQSQNPKMKEILTQIRDEVSSGGHFWQALSKHPGLFSQSYISMVKAGEGGANLEKVIETLSQYSQETQEVKSESLSMLIYPLILSAVGIGTIIFMMVRVIPNMAFVFNNLEQPLPLSTKMLMALSDLTVKYFWVLLIFLFLIVLTVKRLYYLENTRSRWDNFLLKIPFLNDFLKKIYFVRFARITGLMLSNGVNLIDALAAANEVIDNTSLRKKLSQVRDEVSSGAAFALSLSKN